MKVQSILIMSLVVLSGCISPQYHQQHTQDETYDRLTVGKVQREIKVGMSSAQVAEVLGSPNVVTTDEQRREVWVYDKVASDVTYSQSEGYATLILLGTNRSSGSQRTSQKTLTVVVKFDEQGKVRDFAYHGSQF